MVRENITYTKNDYSFNRLKPSSQIPDINVSAIFSITLTEVQYSKLSYVM